MLKKIDFKKLKDLKKTKDTIDVIFVRQELNGKIDIEQFTFGYIDLHTILSQIKFHDSLAYDVKNIDWKTNVYIIGLYETNSFMKSLIDSRVERFKIDLKHQLENLHKSNLDVNVYEVIGYELK